MKNLALSISLALFGAFVFNAHPVSAQTAKKILFFSKSSGFEHDMIQEKNGQPSPAQVILEKIAKDNRTFVDDSEYIGMTTEFYQVLNFIISLQA